MRVLLNLVWLVFGGLVSLTPFAGDIMDVDQARRLGYAPTVRVPADPAHRSA